MQPMSCVSALPAQQGGLEQAAPDLQPFIFCCKSTCQARVTDAHEWASGTSAEQWTPCAGAASRAAA